MERRDVFRILGGALAGGASAAQHHTGKPAGKPAEFRSYEPRFLSPFQYRMLRTLCDIVIPAEPESPGAADVGVPYFIDTVLLYSEAAARESWTRGLAAVDEVSRQKFDRPFLSLDHARQVAVVESIAVRERKPGSDAERFFVTLKGATIEAYYYSEAARTKELKYEGDTVIAEFTGCTHPEHQPDHAWPPIRPNRGKIGEEHGSKRI